MWIDDPNVLYFSVHRYDNGTFYPYTGGITECGKGKGIGFTVNVPWPKPKMGNLEYVQLYPTLNTADILNVGKEY